MIILLVHHFQNPICWANVLYSKQGLATKSWHPYFSSSLMVLGGIDTTPLRSLLSKMVEPSEFGYYKCFCLFVSYNFENLFFNSLLQKNIYICWSCIFLSKISYKFNLPRYLFEYCFIFPRVCLYGSCWNDVPGIGT